ncbi:MAG: Flp pilus assembly protein TadD [Dyella sp.]
MMLVVAWILTGCSSNPTAHKDMHPDIAADAGAAATDNQAMYLDLIAQMQQQGAYFASLAHVQAFRKQYGNPPLLRRLEADALRETGQSDTADRAYRSLLNSTQAAAAWHGLGLIAASKNDFADADKDLSRAVDLDPVNVSYLGDQGFARLRAGALSEARTPLAKAAELAPGNLKAVSNLVVWSLLAGHPDQAEAMMQQAKLPPANRAAIVQLAQQLRADARTHADATPPGAATQTAAATAPSSSTPAQIVIMPKSMLDRFSGSSTRKVQP